MQDPIRVALLAAHHRALHADFRHQGGGLASRLDRGLALHGLGLRDDDPRVGRGAHDVREYKNGFVIVSPLDETPIVTEPPYQYHRMEVPHVTR